MQDRVTKTIKTSWQASDRMGKEGLHYLAYSLTLDPAEEIRGALENVASKNWQELQSLDKLLEDTPDPETLEAEVQDVQVYANGSGAQYQTDDAELPANYQHSSYSTPDAEQDVSYAGWQEAAEAYEQELDTQVAASIWKMNYTPTYASAEEADRVENYKTSLGWAMRFLLYAIKAATI